MTNSSTKHRPQLFRALGKSDPPETIVVDGRTYQHVRTYKHDSWAATALYACDGDKLVCKFNRTQSIAGLPLFWLGWWLARRERRMYQLLQGAPGVAAGVGEVHVAGRKARHAVAHTYVAGHPLRWHDRVDDAFFPALRETLDEIHRRGVVYVDLNKRENIIVDEQGRPYLVDFQISARLPRIWPCSLLLQWLQQMDIYHWRKHFLRLRPDLHGFHKVNAFEEDRPWWIRLHRKVFAPVRELRRRLLVRLGIRRGTGKASSETFTEEALRFDQEHDSELLRLHSTLVSDRYYQQKGGADERYVTGMFEDLFQRSPQSDADRRLVESLLETRSRHHVSSVMLRTTEIVLRSNNLSDEVLREWNQRIVDGLKAA